MAFVSNSQFKLIIQYLLIKTPSLEPEVEEGKATGDKPSSAVGRSLIPAVFIIILAIFI
jgi:hypothetical protein